MAEKQAAMAGSMQKTGDGLFDGSTTSGEGRSTAVISKSGQLAEVKPGSTVAVMIGNRKINLKIVSGSRDTAVTNKPNRNVSKAGDGGVSPIIIAGGASSLLPPVEPAPQEQYVSPQVVMAQRILAGLHPTDPHAAPPDEEGEVVCMFCGCCFGTTDELASHEPLCAAGEADDGAGLTCHCGKKFSHPEALSSHMQIHDSEEAGNYACRFCGKYFGSALMLATHERVHSVIKPFRCSYCNKAFTKKAELVNHERLHEGGANPLACSYCEKICSSRAKLMEHESQHTGGKPFNCNFCTKSFSQKHSLMQHERLHAGGEEKPFQCPICTKCFARQSNYNVHMKLHASGRRFFCSYCGKWYRSEPEMLEHQEACLAQLQGQPLLTEKPLRYQCSYCDKMFHFRRDKFIHERVHTGERPYTCGYCQKAFTQSQALTIHIRTHTGERPYTCSLCGRDFRDSSSLRKHEFVKHTNTQSALGGTSGGALYTSVYGDHMDMLEVDGMEDND